MTHPKTMTLITLVIASTFFSFSGKACDAADPFYYSTWYAPPNPAYSWASASVLPIDRYDRLPPGGWPVNFDSPLFYQPGYGYVAPTWPFRSTLRYYEQGYAFGALSYGPRPITSLNPTARINGYSALGVQNRFGGINNLGLLHAPYYLPGSPGNDREFLFRW